MGDTVDKMAAIIDAKTIPPANGSKSIIRVGSANFAFSKAGYFTLAAIPKTAVKIPNGATAKAVIKADFLATCTSLAAKIG